MKVFISWSGEYSHKVALIFRDWLPSVIQNVEPYVSSEDIDKGARWSTDISKELEESSYGILCITKDNLEASWLNFEAGALSKSFDKSRVSPFLFGIKRAEVKGPTLQFQSTTYDREDIKKLLISINSACESGQLDEARLESVFDVWWPKLQEAFDELASQKPAEEDAEMPEKQLSRDTEIIEEILDLVRSQQIILNNPDEILPREYLTDIVRSSQRTKMDEKRQNSQMLAIRELSLIFNELQGFVYSYQEHESIPFPEIVDIVNRLEKTISYLSKDMIRFKRRLQVRPGEYISGDP